ncbi:MAG: type II toxin-antitoxin system RelE/ParE family toxin, partial [Planctomycetes bacterium]|nr:type II toxin-antitoxin system RelE/ParE family toxin [Planctomycetota bacterium]
RSEQGAARWYQAARDAISRLAHDAEQQGYAPEDAEVAIRLRQKFFKTRRGRPYRLLYTIVGKEVRVLRVRGPGQAPVTADDISE